MTRVDARPRCRHGRPTADYCAECAPPSAGRRLTDDLAALGVVLVPDHLHLPPTARHAPAVCSAKGKLTVTCSCGRFRARASSTDQNERSALEEGWGRHRGT